MDVPRTAPGVPFFAQKQLQKSLERILYLWGIRCCNSKRCDHDRLSGTSLIVALSSILLCMWPQHELHAGPWPCIWASHPCQICYL